MVVINYSDLEFAMQFSSADSFIDACAYVSRETGEFYWETDDIEMSKPLPDPVEDPDLYIAVPSQRDLNLGKSLALKFASQALPEKYDEVATIFRKKGAYSRYKDLLMAYGLLDEWYRFEQTAIKYALTEWATYEGFTVTEEPDKTTVK